MARDGEIRLGVDVDARKAERQLDDFEQSIEEVGDATDRAAEKSGAATQEMSDGISEANRGWDDAAGKVAGYAAAAIAALQPVTEMLKEQIQLQREGRAQAFDVYKAAGFLGATPTEALALQQTGVDLGFGEQGMFDLAQALSYGLSDPENKVATRGLLELGLDPEEIRDLTPGAQILNVLDAVQQRLPQGERGNFLRNRFQLRREQSAAIDAAQGNIVDTYRTNIEALPENTAQVLEASRQASITEQRQELDKSVFGGRQEQGTREYQEGRITGGSALTGLGQVVESIASPLTGTVGQIPGVGGIVNAPVDAIADFTGSSLIELSGDQEFGSVRPRDEYVRQRFTEPEGLVNVSEQTVNNYYVTQVGEVRQVPDDIDLGLFGTDYD